MLIDWVRSGGQENIWLSARTYGPSAARSVRPNLEPNISSSGPPTQSISTYWYKFTVVYCEFMNLIGYIIVCYLLIVNSYASVHIARHVWTWCDIIKQFFSTCYLTFFPFYAMRLRFLRAKASLSSATKGSIVALRLSSRKTKRDHAIETPQGNSLEIVPPSNCFWNLVCQYFCWMLGDPHFFLADHFLSWFFPLY